MLGTCRHCTERTKSLADKMIASCVTLFCRSFTLWCVRDVCVGLTDRDKDKETERVNLGIKSDGERGIGGSHLRILLDILYHIHF